jgi:hypothetical protein
MNIRSNLFLLRASVAALVLAASVLSLGATAAKAQFLFNWDRAVPPMEVERMVEASGYRLTGPVMRRGPVYLANVLGRDNDRERLVIDARDGRLLQRYGAEERRQYAASDDWSSRPRPRDYMFDGGFERDEDGPAPRPPAEVFGDSGQLLHGPFVRPAPQGSEVARAEDPAGRPGAAVDSSDPYVLLAPPDVGHASDKAKPKPQAKHKKPDTTPVAQPTANPADAKPAPVAVQSPANPQPAANPQAAVNPDVPTPAAPAKQEPSGPQPAPIPHAAITPPVAPPPHPDVASQPAPTTPAPRVADIKQEPASPPPAANPPAAITAPVAMPARPVSARQATPVAPAPRVADIKPERPSTPPAANPPAAITPPVVMPAHPVSAHQSAPAPRVADTKPVAAPTLEIAPAAPPPKPTRPKPALNDVPVAPLE